MIKVEKLPHNYRHKVSGKIEYINFFPILDNLLQYGYKNNFNLTHEKIDISSKFFKDAVYTLRLEHSENSNIFVDIGYYESSGFYDIKFSYKIGETEWSNKLETYDLNVVLACMYEVSKLLNRSLE